MSQIPYLKPNSLDVTDPIPQTLSYISGGFDAQESVLRRSLMEVTGLGVGKERIRPPYLVQHFITYTKLLLWAVEFKSLVLPVLAEVEIQSEILT